MFNSIGIKQSNGLNIVELPQSLSPVVCLEFKRRIKDWLGFEGDAFVLDFKVVDDYTQLFFWQVEEFQRKLSTRKKDLFSINLSGALKSAVKSLGFEDVLCLRQSVGSIITEIGDRLKSSVTKRRVNHKLDAKFVNLFTASVGRLFKNANIAMKACDPKVIKKNAMKEQTWVGQIFIENELFCGTVCLIVSKRFMHYCAEKVFSHLGQGKSRMGNPDHKMSSEGEEKVHRLLTQLFLELEQDFAQFPKMRWGSWTLKVLKNKTTQKRHIDASKILLLPYAGDEASFCVEMGVGAIESDASKRAS